ncbi:DNA mismatch repair protein MSH6 [Clonorchis sinensis]|uniref:DNA mismatch repair protein MSH6 n=1 Tax=Clonorchis sinensis TaxID=79923 RepID=H2KQV6_CLOSI|nr:DNA mismatch repair protein MSH6 [Clonorchis sinensis]
MDVDAAKQWSLDWHLPLNDEKCAYMSFGGDSANSFVMHGEKGPEDITRIDAKKDLGIWLSPNMSFSLHLEKSAQKAFAVLLMIRRTFSRITRTDFQILYGAYARPLLENADPVVYSGRTKDVILIERVQRAATKMVAGLKSMGYETPLAVLDLFPLQYCRLRGDLILTYALFEQGLANGLFTVDPANTGRGHDERQPLNDKNKTGPTNLGKSLDPAYQSVNLCLVAYSPKLSRKSVTSDSDTLSRSLNETIGDNIVEASDVNDSVVDGEAASWEHLKLPFLKKENLMDSARRKPSHPDYDPRTLFVPGDFLAKQSPGMRQWWELKSKYADAILFFKVGKFYEMYHMDAAVGVEHLGLVYMKGSFAHCGFPEIAFSRMSEQLVKKGYKVARVEQTESVDAMTERTRGRPGSEKVVKREVCQLSTPGTCTTSMRTELSYSSNATVSDSEDGAVSTEALDTAPESFLLAIGEETSSGSSEHVFGVALLNAINGTILMGQFHDDRHCGRLRTLISHYFPSQIIVEKGSVSHSIKILLKTCLSGVPVEYLTHGKQFWSAKETIIELETAGYFSSAEHGKQQSISDSRHYPLFPGKENWPGTLVRMLSEDDPLGRSVKTDYDLAMSCLGAIVYYLRYCLIDRQVMSLGLIDLYMPPDCLQIATTTGSGQVFYSRQTSLVLDSITLANLDILHNSVTGTREGTLLERLDTCCTPFGRRLLRQWLTAPPCNPKLIRARQDAVDNLIDIGGQLNSIKLSLRRLPDFERLLTKIHLVGSKKNEKNHPDARAILFEEVQYSRRNIVDFLATLHGFEVACEIITQLESFSLCESRTAAYRMQTRVSV